MSMLNRPSAAAAALHHWLAGNFFQHCFYFGHCLRFRRLSFSSGAGAQRDLCHRLDYRALAHQHARNQRVDRRGYHHDGRGAGRYCHFNNLRVAQHRQR